MNENEFEKLSRKKRDKNAEKFIYFLKIPLTLPRG